MTKDHALQAGSTPAQHPSSATTANPMLSATASNNHTLFSFGRSNGVSAMAAKHSNSTIHGRPSGHGSNDDDDDGTLDPDRITAGFDFLPSVSFDDLQSSLESASTEFKLAQFPSPSGQGSILADTTAVDKMVEESVKGPYGGGSAAAEPSTSAAAATTTRIAVPSSASAVSAPGRTSTRGGGASILRRPSITTTRQSGGSTALASSSSTSAIPDVSSVPSNSARQRRQSHYPPVSNSNIGKPPRKSIGPGVLESEYSSSIGRSGSRRRPSVASVSDRSAQGSASTRSSIDGSSRLSGGGDTTSRGPLASRSTKVRSFPSAVPKSNTTASVSTTLKPTTSSASASFRASQGGGGGSSSTSTIVNHAAFSTPNGVIKGAPAAAGGGHPSSGKRMSMAPAALHASHASHATGLGARTVSPTDARRMKRMSIMPSNSSINSSFTANGSTVADTSSIPLPTPADNRASSRSPSMLPRKTSTPSSLRTTPDPNRKSYSSGLSVGSSMSFNTVRSSTGSIQPRLPQPGGSATSGGSRLPAPKTSSAHPPMPGGGDDEEDVPPVPAIPKAYESPKNSPAELSFLEKRKSNLALDDGSIRSSSTTGSLTGVHATATAEPPAKLQQKTSTRLSVRDADRANHTISGVPLRGSSNGSNNNNNTTNTSNGKKNLQPLYLPPLNLMPLSVPTTTKIAALQEQGSSGRNLSPPPSRIIAKTPTTPMTMTVSKGSFFARNPYDDRTDLSASLRSTSSVLHHAHRESPRSGGDSGSSTESITAVSLQASSFRKPSMSPFLSSSAPRNGLMDAAFIKRYQSGAGAGDGDDGNASVLSFKTAPPPIPASTPSLPRPSGPRAPAPTPSRAFAAFDAASTIVPTGDTSLMDTSYVKAPPTPKSPEPVASPDEPPTPSSIGSSLRRKLSLSWKRNNSKSSINLPPGALADKAAASSTSTENQQPQVPPKPQQQQQQQQQQQRQPSNSLKHDGMPPPPPPRIPKSATLGQMPSAKPSGSPAKGGETYLESRRRKTSASSLNAILAQEPARTDTWPSASDRAHKKDVSAAPKSDIGGTKHAHSQHAHVHNATVMQKILKPKTSSSTMRYHDLWTADLDKDDLVAEEEMRRLGSRRKETELAARTLDALRKRATPKERVGAQEAIRIAMLNIYERGEIVDYNDVYFCGTQNAAKVVGNLKSDAPNFGYDDERGDYAIVPGDHLAYRYEIIDLLGKGSFGQVVRCIDHKTGVLVAVKIIRNKKRFHQQALVEVNILQKLREWDPKNKHSMVNFTHSFYFRGHLCISTELLDMNLYEFIKANAFRGFSLKMIRRFTKQLLSSLMLLKQHKVIHCDLKPENILLRHPLHTEIKVIDFGSSCFENEKVYTYIQSRFYRSPEVILGMTYGMPIDMWSLGCILAELYTGVPIFPGENEQEQLACIMEVFGPPEKHLIEKSTRKKLFFDSVGKPRLTVSSKGRRRRPSSKTLQQVIKCDDDAFLDFLARCLRWDPDRRLKPEDAIRHEFITGHKPSAMPPPPLRGAAGQHHHHHHVGGGGSTRDGSPLRRHNTVTAGPRPLPEPPSSSAAYKLGAPPPLRASLRDGSGMSPHKSATGPTMSSSRRTSAVTSSTVGKRTSAGMAGGGGGGGGGAGGTGASGRASANTSTVNSGSGLPRAAGRVVSGTSSKSDLAAAGAAAAMTRRA